METIGLIGCGEMGSGIAYSLKNKGYEVMVYDYINNKNVDLLMKNNIKFVDMQKLTQNCKIIIMCLPDAKAVEDVCFGEYGLLNMLSTKSILIDTTTSHPKTTQKINKCLKNKKIKFADAPLTRSPIEAMQGRLNSLVGADDETYKEIEPVLKAFCENIIRVGEVGSGHEIKLLNNFICMSFTAIVEFGLLCGKELDIDIKTLDKVMSMGSNYVSSIPSMLDYIENKNQDVLKFSLKNATKDMRYFFEMIEDNESKKWFEPIYNIYRDATEDNKNKDKNLPALYEYLKDNENNKKEG